MMNRKQFIADFKENVMPGIQATEQKQGGKADYPLRAETWNDMIDALIKDRQLPKSATNWSNPFDRR